MALLLIHSRCPENKTLAALLMSADLGTETSKHQNIFYPSLNGHAELGSFLGVLGLVSTTLS